MEKIFRLTLFPATAASICMLLVLASFEELRGDTLAPAPAPAPSPPADLSLQGAQIPQTIPLIAAPSTYNLTLYTYIECRVGPLQSGCNGNAPMDVPFNGWQICRAFYTVKQKDQNTSAAFTPDHWSTVDPVEPVSFQRYTVTMQAQGNFGGGADIRYENVGLTMINAAASSQDRYELKCDMPSAPVL